MSNQTTPREFQKDLEELQQIFLTEFEPEILSKATGELEGLLYEMPEWQDECLETILVGLKQPAWRVKWKLLELLAGWFRKAEFAQQTESPVHQALLACLYDEHWCVRMQTADCIGILSLQGCTEALVDLLQNDIDETVRQYAAKALGALRDIHAFSYLEQAIEDPDSDVRKEALGSIARYQTEESIRIFLKCLNQKEQALKTQSLSALQHMTNHTKEPASLVQWFLKLQNHPDLQVKSKTLEFIEQLVRSFGKSILQEPTAATHTLHQVLLRSSTDDQKAASNILRELACPESVKPLLNFLSTSNDKDARWYAGWALSNCCTGESLPALLEALQKEHDEATGNCILESIQKVGSNTQVDALLAYLKGQGPSKKECITVLGAFGDQRALPDLLELLQTLSDQPTQEELAKTLLGAIESICSEDAIPTLIAYIQAQKPAWKQAIEILGLLHTPQSNAFLHSALLEFPTLYEIPCALAKQGDKRVIEPLLKWVEDTAFKPGETYWALLSMLQALVALKEERAVTPMLRLLGNYHEHLKLEDPERNYKKMSDTEALDRDIIELLGQLRSPLSIEPLLELLQAIEPNLEYCRGQNLCKTLGQLKSPVVTSVLKEAFESLPYHREISLSLAKQGVILPEGLDLWFDSWKALFRYFQEAPTFEHYLHSFEELASALKGWFQHYSHQEEPEYTETLQSLRTLCQKTLELLEKEIHQERFRLSQEHNWSTLRKTKEEELLHLLLKSKGAVTSLHIHIHIPR